MKKKFAVLGLLAIIAGSLFLAPAAEAHDRWDRGGWGHRHHNQGWGGRGWGHHDHHRGWGNHRGWDRGWDRPRFHQARWGDHHWDRAGGRGWDRGYYR